MNKSEQHFNVGDFVFAKVSGHPFWPAKVKNSENLVKLIKQMKF